MNTELFIAKRLFFDKENSNHLSKRIINIALVGIALGLAVMMIAISIVTGFKAEIINKVIGFGSHIQIINFDSNNSYETQPVNKNQSFLAQINSLENIQSIQEFGTKPGIIKTENDIQGIILKGIGTNYNWDFFEKYITEGRVPNLSDSIRSNEILISEKIKKLLGYNLGDPVYTYFVNTGQRNPLLRQFVISGIYNTGLAEFDKLFIIGDLKHIQRLNGWESNQISGFEIKINDFKDLDESESIIRELVINYNEEPDSALRTINIMRLNPQIFDWLSILDMNVWVILILMLVVAGINMISGLLVLILERSTMIGVLKALGSPNYSVRKIFIYLSGFLITRGLIWGNLIGLFIIIIQKYFKLMPLDPASYYVDVVPVNLSIVSIVVLNIGTMIVTLAMLVLPSYFISKISPEKTIRFN